MKPEAAAAAFFPHHRCTLRPLGLGNINQTYLLSLDSGKQFVLQRLNPAVFPDPLGIQNNFQQITDHLRKRRGQWGLTPEIVHPVHQAGKSFLLDQAGGLWRLMHYIQGGRTLVSLSEPAQGFSLGAMLGWFHRALADLDPAFLIDPLPGFHDTATYREQLEAQLRRHSALTAEEQQCVERIRHYDHLIGQFAAIAPTLSRQVIHNDPKVANFLFDQSGRRVITLIDLDTVFQGLPVHDLGDCLRSCCNPAGEDVENLAAIRFQPLLFQEMLRGYFSVASTLLQPADCQAILPATELICLELAVRFLTDHLAGNRYFSVQYPSHNLHRAAVQLALLDSLRVQRTVLQTMVSAIIQ